MRSWSLDDLREALEQCIGGDLPLVGVGERAFPRLGPGLFLEKYRILCYLQTADIAQIRSLTPVDCLQEALSFPSMLCRDTLSLLSHPLLDQACLRPPEGTRLLVYRETPALRDLAAQNRWTLLANPSELRARWENKLWFRSRLKEMELRVPPWESLSVEDLRPETYRRLRGAWGTQLVVQIPDFPRGGGRSTFFVRNEEEFEGLRLQLAQGRHRGHPFQELLVSSLIEGPSLSIEGCVTQWGVITSPLQIQFVDLEEVLPPGQGGRFCGHQWGVPEFPPEVEAQAHGMVKRVGHALMAEGYRGIFGLDLALDASRGDLYALECNPRYTGAFPALTILQLAAGLAPLEAFHLLGLLGSPKPGFLSGVDHTRERMPAASQLLLFHRGTSPGTVGGSLQAGRYMWDDSGTKARAVGDLLPLSPPPWDPAEFLILDGPPPLGTLLFPGDELERVVRILFLRPVVRENGRLDHTVVPVVRWVYERLGLGQAPGDGP